MRTQITPTIESWFVEKQASGYLELARDELLKCVHCGMCNATCPTYQITGDELDGPRGRLYQIKSLLEGEKANESHRFHLDRCLQCRSCETTCPSGVGYHHVLEVGKWMLERQLPKKTIPTIMRWALSFLAYRWLSNAIWPMARTFRPLLPETLKNKIPPSVKKIKAFNTNKNNAIAIKTSYILMQGCVQSGMLPNIHYATENLFAHLDINLVRLKSDTCCGSLPYHINHEEKALQMVLTNVHHWGEYIKTHKECKGVIINASGCGLMVRDYPTVLKKEGKVALITMAEKLAKQSFEPMEILQQYTEELQMLMQSRTPPASRVVFQAPCTLQHGLKLQNKIEEWLSTLMAKTSVTLIPVEENHLCCGSAGTYSIQQPEMSEALRIRKWDNLTRNCPDIILTANVGCHSHLQGAGNTPVQHYIEFIAEWLGH